MVCYDPLVLPAAALVAHIDELMQGGLEGSEAFGRCWSLPVCYDSAFAPDLDHVAALTGLSAAQVIERHSALTYHVYMLGFLPGQAYMGDLPAELVLPRRETPRPKVPAGSLAIATTMTCIFPLETPCGWHLIGRSPVALWENAPSPRALLAPGDKVTFGPVSLREYEDSGARGRRCDRRTPRDAWGRQHEAQLARSLAGSADHGSGPGRPGISSSASRRRCARSHRLRAANALVGNPPGAGALEVVHLGPTLHGRGRERAPRHSPARMRHRDSGRADQAPARAVETMRSVRLRRGEVLRIGALSRGAVLYMAVEGGFAIEPVLGSLSTYVRGGLGGWQGRALIQGDRLPLCREAASVREDACLTDIDLSCREDCAPSMARKSNHFTPEEVAAFFRGEYVVRGLGPHGNAPARTPGRPCSPAIDVISEGIAPGSIQISGSGEPIVLLADRQTTGGYPKIATVISADLPAFGRLPIGAKIGFERVSLAAAAQLRRQLLADVDAISSRIAPIAGARERDASLLQANLISGVVDACTSIM